MKFSEVNESVKIALDSIKSNKMRSFLASLGVVVGISVVILMGWALSALDKALDDTFELMGADMIYLDKWDWTGSVKWEDQMQRKDITKKQADQFIKKIKSAEIATPEVSSNGVTIKYQDKSISTAQCSGTLSDYSLTKNGEVIQGRYFSEIESRTSTNVVVIGYNINKSLFPNDDAIGKIIKINGHKFTVIGVSKKQSTVMMDFLDNIVKIPIRTFAQIFGKNMSYSISIKAGSQDKLEEVKVEAEGIMRSLRNIQPGKPNDFSLNDSKQFEDMMGKFRIYVWGIGIGMTILSFIVGIIGIMNILFVSVVERTKEIGIRKALGAPKRSILFQFIVEAAVLCLIGAIVSLIVCSILVFALANILPIFVPTLSFLEPFMPLNLFIIATIVSIVVGILAGFIPAFRASNLNVVDALRYE